MMHGSRKFVQIQYYKSLYNRSSKYRLLFLFCSLNYHLLFKQTPRGCILVFPDLILGVVAPPTVLECVLAC